MRKIKLGGLESVTMEVTFDNSDTNFRTRRMRTWATSTLGLGQTLLMASLSPRDADGGDGDGEPCGTSLPFTQCPPAQWQLSRPREGCMS